MIHSNFFQFQLDNNRDRNPFLRRGDLVLPRTPPSINLMYSFIEREIVQFSHEMKQSLVTSIAFECITCNWIRNEMKFSQFRFLYKSSCIECCTKTFILCSSFSANPMCVLMYLFLFFPSSPSLYIDGPEFHFFHRTLTHRQHRHRHNVCLARQFPKNIFQPTTQPVRELFSTTSHVVRLRTVCMCSIFSDSSILIPSLSDVAFLLWRGSSHLDCEVERRRDRESCIERA